MYNDVRDVSTIFHMQISWSLFRCVHLLYIWQSIRVCMRELSQTLQVIFCWKNRFTVSYISLEKLPFINLGDKRIMIVVKHIKSCNVIYNWLLKNTMTKVQGQFYITLVECLLVFTYFKTIAISSLLQFTNVTKRI